MDCSTAHLLLEFHRPHVSELDPAEIAALESHLTICHDCETFRHSQQQIDQHLGRAMREVPLPEGLFQNVFRSLQAQRRTVLRRQVSRAVRCLAAAVFLLGLLSTVCFILRASQRRLDVVAMFNGVMWKMTNPCPELVQDWYKDYHKVDMIPPPRFNYPAYLVHFGMGECQGQMVPELVFANAKENTRAWVFVVTDKQFDLDQLPRESLDTQGFHMEIWPGAPGTAYIIIYTGDSLTPLLQINSSVGHGTWGTGAFCRLAEPRSSPVDQAFQLDTAFRKA